MDVEEPVRLVPGAQVVDLGQGLAPAVEPERELAAAVVVALDVEQEVDVAGGPAVPFFVEPNT